MLTVLVAIPAVLVVSLALVPHWGVAQLAIHALVVATWLVFVFIWGKYTLMGSYYLRFLPPVAFLVAAVIAWRRKRAASGKPSTIGRIVQIVTIGGSLLTDLLCGSASSYRGKRACLSLEPGIY